MPPKKDKPSGAQYRKSRAQAQLELEKNAKMMNKYFNKNSGTCETSTSTSDARNESINDIDENIFKTPVKHNNETSTSTLEAKNESINSTDENIS
ncbi:unnamed protein product [Macrosiphum euphorbiae]|uniref:Uncharacterized protein n=1 Tax=Macrosiphum euphorbiae TaxID=13131 RepID=A0AAV0WTD3_9HEMI|nr:unnamed protein product [Macrosiphum euphorbiae]